MNNHEARAAAVSGVLAAVLIMALTVMALGSLSIQREPLHMTDMMVGANADTQGR